MISRTTKTKALGGKIPEKFSIHVSIKGQAPLDRPVGHIGKVDLDVDGSNVVVIQCTPLETSGFSVWPYHDTGPLPNHYTKMRLRTVTDTKKNTEDIVLLDIKDGNLREAKEEYDMASSVLEAAIASGEVLKPTAVEMLYILRCTIQDELISRRPLMVAKDNDERRSFEESLLNDLFRDIRAGADLKKLSRAVTILHRCNEYINWAFTTKDSQSDTWYSKKVGDRNAYVSDEAESEYMVWIRNLLAAIAAEPIAGWLETYDPQQQRKVKVDAWNQIVQVGRDGSSANSIDLLQLELFFDYLFSAFSK